MSLFTRLTREPPWEAMWEWPLRRDFTWSLRRRLGRIVRVGTCASVKRGRLVDVADDYIVLRRKGRKVLIRTAAICWVRTVRNGRRPSRRRGCACRRAC